MVDWSSVCSYLNIETVGWIAESPEYVVCALWLRGFMPFRINSGTYFLIMHEKNCKLINYVQYSVHAYVSGIQD